MKRITTVLASLLLIFSVMFGLVSNTEALGPNLIANPSAESGSVGSPTSWLKGRWGTNTTTFTHVAGGYTGSYALNVKTTAFTSGDAKWYFAPVTVTPSTTYTFSNWYKSTAKTTVAAVVTTTSGATSFISLGTPAASSTWKHNSYNFVTPSNASKVTIYHFIETVGELTTDDYSLATADTSPTPPTPPNPPTPTPTPTPVGNNLVVNPSLETAASATTPSNWSSSKWGTNTSALTYATTGNTGSRSAQISTTAYTSGGSYWLHGSVPVTAGKIYQHSNWYKSSVKTSIYVRYTFQNSTTKEVWLGDAQPSANWTQYKTRITAPLNATRISVFQTLKAVGTLNTDDYSISEATPAPYTRPIVSITFDDGWADQYTTARPILNDLGYDATYYIISGNLNTRYYMTNAQVQSLHSEGNDISSHSVSHPDFTKLTAAQVSAQFASSQTALQNLIGAPVSGFAYPYGYYTTDSLTAGKSYYTNQRSIDPGMNYKDDIDATRLKSVVITNTTTAAEVQHLIDAAIANNAWLILCYHEIAAGPVPGGDAAGTVTPANFTTHMNYLKSKNVSVQTVKSALTEVQAQ